MKKIFFLILAGLMMVASWSGFMNLHEVTFRFFMFVSALLWMSASFVTLADICGVNIPLFIEEEDE